MLHNSTATDTATSAALYLSLINQYKCRPVDMESGDVATLEKITSRRALCHILAYFPESLADIILLKTAIDAYATEVIGGNYSYSLDFKQVIRNGSSLGLSDCESSLAIQLLDMIPAPLRRKKHGEIWEFRYGGGDQHTRFVNLPKNLDVIRWYHADAIQLNIESVDAWFALQNDDEEEAA